VELLILKGDEINGLSNKSNINLQRIDEKGFLYCVGKNLIDEGYFIVWEVNGKNVGTLDYPTYGKILQEAKKAGLKTPYHIYVY